eukprot:869838-Amphidinium_carterae.3
MGIVGGDLDDHQGRALCDVHCEEAGKLVQKYCVLYKGRMEFYSSVEDSLPWCLPTRFTLQHRVHGRDDDNSWEDAKSAAVPATGTFWLEELSKIDHVGLLNMSVWSHSSGVVLSLEGKYVGLHADSEVCSRLGETIHPHRPAAWSGLVPSGPQFHTALFNALALACPQGQRPCLELRLRSPSSRASRTVACNVRIAAPLANDIPAEGYCFWAVVHTENLAEAKHG